MTDQTPIPETKHTTADKFVGLIGSLMADALADGADFHRIVAYVHKVQDMAARYAAGDRLNASKLKRRSAQAEGKA